MSEPTDDLQRFAERARDGAWTGEPVGISMDISSGLYRYRKFREISRRMVDDTIIFEAEWLGSGDALSDVSREFFASYGEFAEDSQFIRRVIERDDVVFHVISGDIDHPRHGHRFQIRLVGPRIAKVIRGYQDVGGVVGQ